VRITIVSFQKSRTSDLHNAEQEYIKRLSRHTRVDLLPVRSWDDRSGLPDRLLKSTLRIGLYVDGKTWESQGMATHIQNLMNQGQSHLVYAIGAADGMPAGISSQVQERWSLSSLTFGHQLARLVLLESLYRSFDILHGGRYHK
jgi:23S rRNA (pseudouridine1915-N3)-methyltransferase